jgi:geranylgeranyl pyrophosphate synthase
VSSAVGDPAADNSSAGRTSSGKGSLEDALDADRSAGEVSATGDVEALDALMRRSGAGMRERLARIELHLERVTAAAGAPLARHASATIMAGGKRLRPLLVVIAAEAAGADLAPSEMSAPHAARLGVGGSHTTVPSTSQSAVELDKCLIRAAVAVELVHSATLVHDDVIDRAQLRRGHPTVAATAGPRTAVATGDLLFSRAFAELAQNDDPAQLRALSDASAALAAGELLQREDAYAAHVTIERYLRRCELKTAALFEAACRLGVLVAVGGAGFGSQDLADALGAFARRIGLAFQILDDVLDVSGSVERTGKSRGTDLLDGTVTLPLILARERDSDLATLDLAVLDGALGEGGAGEGASEVQTVEELCDRIAATGALSQARERALALVAEAKTALPTSLPAGRATLLELVADSVVERYR